MIHSVFSEETEGFLGVSAIGNFQGEVRVREREDSNVRGRKGWGTRVGGVGVAGWVR